jgi:hypothetical protein
MSTSLVQVESAIIFKVTDLQLAIEIDQLLKRHNQIEDARSQPAKLKPHNGNGKAKKDPETKAKLLNLLKERFTTSSFTFKQAYHLVKTAHRVSANTLRRALKLGIENETLNSEKKECTIF